MTKLTLEWKRRANQAKVQIKSKSKKSETEESQSNRALELNIQLDAILNPSDGPGKPNSINNEDLRPNGPSIISTAHLCAKLTKNVKTFEGTNPKPSYKPISAINEMSGDVACLDIAPVPERGQRSCFLAVGSYDNTIRILSLDCMQASVGGEDKVDHPASLFLNAGLQNGSSSGL
ncbi:splicing factor 3B subunit 3 [Tanacetum coccineum]